MSTDNELLAEYARQGAEPAFRELVRRHINMVHSAALRESGGNVSLAEDITQEVFAELARRAAKLASHPALAGWLYTCVRQMAANARRSEHRRQRREQEAVTMNELLEPNDSEVLWRQIRPVLDDAMHELNHEDRTAVVLRFFEGLSLKEVGATLGLTENAARMRVERSLGKLHGLLSRRGINSTAATLAAVLIAGTILSTSSTFASSVAAGAINAAGSGSVSVAKFITMAKSKFAIAGSLAALAAAAILWHNLGANSGGKTGIIQPVAATTPGDTNDAPQSNAVVPATAPTATAAASSQMLFHLVDADTTEPLAGAKLHLFYMFEDGRGKVVKAATDGHGDVEVNIPEPPYRALNLFVTAAGHVPKVTSWGFRRSMPAEYTMKLERGVSIGGQVVDEKGQPIAGAKIQIDGLGNDPTLAENIQFGPDAAVKTDANGQWTCDMIPRGFEQVSMLVTDKEHAETNVTVRPSTPEANKLVITMPAGFFVKGTVEDSHGNPIEGATVRQVRLNEENEHNEKTDSSGAFDFKSMPSGELTLAVQADGFAPGVQTIDVHGPVDSLKFQLGPGEILRGRVIDEQGNPVANAFVETTRRAVDKIRWSTNTDADGRFQWNSAPEEALLYSVLAEGFNRAYAQTLEANGSEQVIKLTRKEPDVDTLKIRGTVMDADTGQPLSAFKVFVGERDAEWAFPLDFYTDGQDGQFALTLPSKSSHPGYVVQIEQQGYLPAVSAAYQKTNGNQTLEFKLHKGTGPSGVVLLPGGEPAVNAAVLLCSPLAGVTLNSGAHIQKGLNTTTYRTQTDQTGKFSLPPAVDPEGVIAIHDQGIAQVSFSELAGNSNITLQSWATVKGKLVLESKPVANQEIALFNQDMHYSKTGSGFPFLTVSLETTTDTNGDFVFDKVPPGPCRVFQRVNGFASYQTSITANTGGVTEVILGGAGRSIVGKAVLTSATEPPDWRRVAVRLQSKTGNLPASRPKRSDFSTPESYVAAMKSFMQEYADQKDFVGACESDGSFRLADVPAGDYQLKIELRDARLNSAAPHDLSDPSPVVNSAVRDVIVPDDQSTEPIELGTLELLPQPSSVSFR